MCWRVRWLVADMAHWLCMMMSHLHQADVILGMPTVHADVTITSWWRHHYPGKSHGSGQLVFGSGQPIWAKKMRGARLRARAATSSARVVACGHVRRSISTSFSPVASYRPPLHSGMVKTQFWQLSFLSKKSNTTLNHVLWYQLLGIPSPLCANR